MIDWARVRELRDEIGEEDFPEVVDLFFEEVEELVARLEGGQNVESLESDLHCLKGSALGFGFVEFSELCQKGEKDSAEGRAGEVDLFRVLDSYYRSRDAFRSGLPDHLTA